MDFSNGIFCPLVDKNISIGDCSENQDTRDEHIPAEYKKKPDWREICAKCKWREYKRDVLKVASLFTDDALRALKEQLDIEIEIIED